MNQFHPLFVFRIIPKLGFFLLFLLLSAHLIGQESFRISTFDMDVTPPAGSHYLAYDPQVGTWDMGLRAKGIVIQGAGLPLVLCAIDWIGIGNEGMDVFKGTLAEAAGTKPERVSVHALHQHDAPRCDFSAERILISAGADPAQFNPISFAGDFAREVLQDLRKLVTESMKQSISVDQIGYGEAEIFEVASNRNIYDEKGMVRATRWSASGNASLRAEPEGVIDPMVSLLSFWNGENPVAVLSFYAVHPQSYYRTGIPNPDFPGIARFLRQLAVPEALHVHFNGAGGNVAAGKYNDGSPENRLILAERMADGMKRAWEATVKEPIKGLDIWKVEKVNLPPASHLYDLKKEVEENDSLLMENHGWARKIAFLERMEAGVKTDIGMLKINDVRILFMPGELFVEYQLAAKSYRPDLKVAMAAYGDYGAGYIGTEVQYEKGGYEVSERASNVDPSVEDVLMGVMEHLLKE